MSSFDEKQLVIECRAGRGGGVGICVGVFLWDDLNQNQ